MIVRYKLDLEFFFMVVLCWYFRVLKTLAPGLPVMQKYTQSTFSVMLVLLLCPALHLPDESSYLEVPDIETIQ
jgi:hypothetical protein